MLAKKNILCHNLRQYQSGICVNMKIAKISSAELQSKKNMLKKVEIGIASLAMGSLLSCAPAFAQEPKTDEVSIENKKEENNPNIWKEILVVIGSSAVLFGLLETMGYLLTKSPDKNKIKDMTDFERENFKDFIGR